MRGFAGPEPARENQFRRPDSAAVSQRRGILPRPALHAMTANAGSCVG